MSALPDLTGDGDTWLGADAFAAAMGITVRTLRYYTTLGLLPAPERSGRLAVYGRRHQARLRLIQQLQERGLSMAGIEKAVGPIPDEASVEDIGVHEAVLTTWRLGVPEVVDRAGLDARAGRALTDDEVETMVATGVLERIGRTYAPLDGFDITVELLDLGVPRESIVAAGQAIDRHMRLLAEDLQGILRDHILGPFRAQARTSSDTDELVNVVARLQALTVRAIVSGYHRVSEGMLRRR